MSEHIWHLDVHWYLHIVKKGLHPVAMFPDDNIPELKDSDRTYSVARMRFANPPSRDDALVAIAYSPWMQGSQWSHAINKQCPWPYSTAGLKAATSYIVEDGIEAGRLDLHRASIMHNHIVTPPSEKNDPKILIAFTAWRKKLMKAWREVSPRGYTELPGYHDTAWQYWDAGFSPREAADTLIIIHAYMKNKPVSPQTAPRWRV